MRGESKEGSGGGTTLIVFIVQRNSPMTFKAKTNSERSRRLEDRSRVDFEQLYLVPSKKHTEAPMHAETLKCVQRCSSCWSGSFHTCACALSCTNFSLFLHPPGLTAANSLLASVKTHTHSSTFSSVVAKKYQSQFIIRLVKQTVGLISNIRYLTDCQG